MRAWIGVLAVVSVLSACSSSLPPAADATPGDGTLRTSTPSRPDDRLAFAVIGDVPYGTTQLLEFPLMVDEINAQEDVSFVAHVGDIKAGAQRCDDAHFHAIRAQFDRFRVPLVYTPGDNEWVDCHGSSAGSFDPLERLAALRGVFYPAPGTTLGAPMPVRAQTERGLPENIRFRASDVEFVAVNVQGTNNGLTPWKGIGQDTPTPAQLAEFAHREAADIALIGEAFAEAARTRARAVVIVMHADMFPPRLVGQEVIADGLSGFRKTVEALAAASRDFHGTVYLINGDSHGYNADRPLGAGSPWTRIYGTAPVENLQRVTVKGDADSREWMRFTLTSNNTAPALTWERVPYRSFASRCGRMRPEPAPA